jgi:glucokinase-like ROK family protein
VNASSFLGRNLNLVKAHNVQAVLLSLLHNEKISRVELARSTSLSSTTITNLTAELLEEGLIAEEDSSGDEMQRQVGRPRTMLKLVPDARYAVGVHIGIGLFRVAITNLHAEILHSNMATFALDTPAAQVLEAIAVSVEQAITESGVDRRRVIGVGIGASGLVDYHTGINVLAPRLGWHNVPICEVLKERLALPVCVDNNVRSMALGEAYFGSGQGTGVLAFVYGRVGVGAGFVVDGQVFRGGGAGAGEIGHTVMLPEGGERCTCGNDGCLETLVSESVLIRQAEEWAAQHPDSLLATLLRQEDGRNPIERIFDAARQGDAWTRQLLEERACYLGIALANLVNVLNPERIILGGLFAQGAELFLPAAEQKMRETAFAGLGEKVRLETTSFGWRAGVIGAASLALMTFFYQQSEGI